MSVKVLHQVQRQAGHLAKITRPKYSDIFYRKRLFHTLDHARKRPVVWVCGPPGSGKTILVSSYIEACKIPSLWYQVDRGDEDVATFFYYLGLAAKKIAPWRKKGLPLLTPEYIPSLSIFTRRYFEDLYSRLKTPSCLVFDNYQETSEESFIHEVIRNGLEVIPEGITVIIISRNEPPLILARMHASRSMEVIGGSELCLTLEESREIMKLMLKEGLSREEVEEVYNKTHGWAAGLVLILGKKRRDNIDIKTLKEVSIDTISNYFDSEIFHKIDTDLRNFLLKSAFLPCMDPLMAEMLTGLDDTGRIFSCLTRNNYFTERRFHSHTTYQYHPLFREFLILRAKDTFTRREICGIQKKAALILEESGRLEDAFELFRESSEWEGASRLVTQYANSLIAQGRNGVLEEWIRSLPVEILNNSPWHLYWLGISLLPFRPSQGLIYFEQALNLFRKQRDVEGVFLTWSIIVHSTTHLLCNLKTLNRWVPMLDELIREFGGLPMGHIGARAANSMFMALVYWQPGHPEIASWAERAQGLLLETKDLNIRVETGINLAYFKAITGDFTEAAVIVDSFQELNKKSDIPLLILSIKWMESMYLTLTGSYEKCLGVVSEGLKLADSTGVHLFDFMLMGHGTLSALNAGDLKTSKGYLDRMSSTVCSARLGGVNK